MRRRRLAATALLAASVVPLVWALRGPPEPAAVPTAAPVVPAWSARRLPLLLAANVGELRLPQEVDAALGSTSACLVLEHSGQTVYAREANAALIPASTQKLLVATAALSAFGGEHRFETRVVAASPPRGGAVDRLWVVGGGDPVLMVDAYKRLLDADPLTAGHPATPLETLADAVAAAGIVEVEGPVVGDASRHDGDRVVPTWPSSYITDHDVPYLAALTVNGGWSAWDPQRVTAPDPPAYAAAELIRLLEARGVEVRGGPETGVAPDGAAEVGMVRSPPLSEIVEAMLRESDNLMAELVVRELGFSRGGGGNTPAGVAQVVAEIGSLGVDVAGVALVDGSGLDRGNLATCGALAGALAVRRRSGFEALDRGLAVAARTGTLHERFAGTPLEGVLRAKTGSLRGVVGLAGVIDDPSLAFAFLANGAFGFSAGGLLQDRVARVVAAYPFLPGSPEVLAPPPAQAAG